VITGVGPSDLGAGLVGPNYLAKLDASGSPLWTQAFAFPVKADVDFDGEVAVMSIGTVSLAASASFGAGPVLPAGVTLQPQNGSSVCAGIGLVGVAVFEPDGTHRWSRGITYIGGNQGQGLKLEAYDVAAARHGGLDVRYGTAGSSFDEGSFYVDSLPPSCATVASGGELPYRWTSGHFRFAP